MRRFLIFLQDPREYLPYLQSLQELSALRRSFAIDDRLGRRRKALGHLYELKSFEDFDAYTQNHELYADALQLVRYQPGLLNNTMRLFADFLSSHDRFKEAGFGMIQILEPCGMSLKLKKPMSSFTTTSLPRSLIKLLTSGVNL